MENQNFKPEFDILCVGAGISSLSFALHLKKLINESNDENLKKIKIAILEKASEIGDHVLSGAVFNPKTLRELIPDLDSKRHPSFTNVEKDEVRIFSKRYNFKLPITPPQLSNKGNVILSLADLTRWLAELCEEAGIEIYTAETGKDILFSEDGSVVGVRTIEKGLNKDGKRKSNYLPGTEIKAKLTIFAEGSKGYLTKKLIEKFSLDKNTIPQGYAIGVKELWEVPNEVFEKGKVVHAMGYPLGLSTLGGGFMYHFDDNLVAIGHVTSLDYKNANLDPFDAFQAWKQNPVIKKVISKGRHICYGAKTIAEGGYFAVPKLYGSGFMIIGESASLLNSMKLKGIDMAIQSGMFAAKTALQALQTNDFSEGNLEHYSTLIKNSWINKDLKKSRNFHQGFHNGLIPGMIHAALQVITFGRGLINRFKTKPDYECMKKQRRKPKTFRYDNKLTFDRPTEIYASGTIHEEDQPCHLHVNEPKTCTEKCLKEYGAPCTRFCPAKVYEIIEGEDGKPHLQINFTNCVHCKTCEIKDPYNIIEWEPPESGGPKYGKM